MLQPVVRRTWAPRGQTPVLACWDRHDRLSVISALTVSPQRRRLGLYFDIYDHNIVAEDFAHFVARLLRRIGRPITLVLDRWQVHKSGVLRLQQRFGRRVRVQWLPAYAPELNPTEQVWVLPENSWVTNGFSPLCAVVRYGRAVGGPAPCAAAPSVGHRGAEK